MTGALEAGEVAALLAPLAPATAIALAVSGGADSLALLAAVAGWRRAPGRPAVTVLTVDHGLSPGSDRVAAGVVAAATGLGLPARLLRWTGPKPGRDVEAAARRARYALLFAAAREAGASHILTAHSRDDQAETFLMRLERGSGLFGLAAMRRTVEADGVILFRPFLGVPRARLAATTAAAGLAPHEDPMNADPRFQRVRMRRFLPDLAQAGLTAEVIAATAARLADAADAIDAAVDGLVAGAVAVDPFAVVTVRRDALAMAPGEVRFRLMVRLLQAVGGEDYPPRSARVASLLAALSDVPESRPVRRTLAGAVVEGRRDVVRLWREGGRRGLPAVALPAGFRGVWDHRFAVTVSQGAPPGLVLSALGSSRAEGLARPARLPSAAMATLPAVFAGKSLVALPSLNWGEGGLVAVAECVSDRLAAPRRFPAMA